MPYPSHKHIDRCMPDEVLAVPHYGKQLIEIILLKEEFLHDIEANIRQIEKQRPADAPALLDSDGKDNYLLCRYIDTAVSQAVSRCQAYLLLPSPFVHRISTNHAHEWDEKSIYLAMPMNWPPHVIGTLQHDVHNFIVYRAMQLFLAFADEKAAQQSDYQASLFHNAINVDLNSRLGPLRTHSTFLG